MKRKDAVLLVVILVTLLSTSGLQAGNTSAEAGGARQQERAEREWAAESKETRDRVEHEMREQAAERAAHAAEKAAAARAAEQAAAARAAEAAAKAQATKNSTPKPDVRTLEALTIKKEDALASKQATEAPAADTEAGIPSGGSGAITIREQDGKRMIGVEIRDAAGEVIQKTEWPEGSRNSTPEAPSSDDVSADSNRGNNNGNVEGNQPSAEVGVPDQDSGASNESEVEAPESETNPTDEIDVPDANFESLTPEEVDALREWSEKAPPIEVDDSANDDIEQPVPPGGQ